MGGSVNQAFKDATNTIADIPVIGRGLSNAATYLTVPGLAFSAAAAVDREEQGRASAARAPGEARDAAAKAAAAQSAAAEDAKHQLLIQPKQVTPDNFLANKATQLANLRLGMASTIVGSGKTAAAATPSLTGDYPGKKTLGS